MGRHSKQTPKTVADFVAALQKIDQSLPVLEADENLPGWFEVVKVESRDNPQGDFQTVDHYVVVGTFLDSAYAQMWDHQQGTPGDDVIHPDDIDAFGGLKLPEGYDREGWTYGD